MAVCRDSIYGNVKYKCVHVLLFLTDKMHFVYPIYHLDMPTVLITVISEQIMAVGVYIIR